MKIITNHSVIECQCGTTFAFIREEAEQIVAENEIGDFILCPNCRRKHFLTHINVWRKKEEPKKELRLISIVTSSNFGKLGVPTKMKDKDKNPLFVGDVIKHKFGERFVCENNGEQFVAGIAGDCNQETGEINKDWVITKIKNWSELKVGDKVDWLKVVDET